MTDLELEDDPPPRTPLEEMEATIARVSAEREELKRRRAKVRPVEHRPFNERAEKQ